MFGLALDRAASRAAALLLCQSHNHELLPAKIKLKIGVVGVTAAATTKTPPTGAVQLMNTKTNGARNRSLWVRDHLTE